MQDVTGVGELTERFRRFAAGARHDGASRYSRICEGATSDVALLQLVAGAPPAQRRPNLLLAAVHFLLLSGVDDELAACYPTVLAWRGMELADVRAPAPVDPFPLFAAFCRRHHDAVAQIVATRVTQTNEVGRCTAIFPALSTVASRSGTPIAVVDLGAAAGLNLLFDRYSYGYDYGDGNGSGVLGDHGSPVLLHCEVRDGTAPDGTAPDGTAPDDAARGDRPPTEMPIVAARIGLDRRPVDVHDDDQALWLLACQWPDHFERFDTAHRALTLARSVPDAPLVLRGDAVEDLASVVATLPADAHVCVLHTWAAAYLTPREQRALADTVAGLASARPVSWLFAETPYEVPELPLPTPAGEKVLGATAVVLVEQAPGSGPVAHRVADMHPHGRWLRWYGASG